ncbi:hypothetical protein U0070_009889 [Myodes glareolus]|uniref:Uncharacterized protein n=1 Tax=Myodes glareolus TaxID=447135 RepID=A0AAW0JGH7_MYOGA
MPEPSSARQTQGSRRAPVSFRCDELWEEFVLHRLEDEFSDCHGPCYIQRDGCLPPAQADPAIRHHHCPVPVPPRPQLLLSE